MPAADTAPFTRMLLQQAPGSVCHALTDHEQPVVIAHRYAPAHEFHHPGSPYLGILAVPHCHATQAVFNLGHGWKDHYCPHPKPVHLLPDSDFRWSVNDASLTVMLAIPMTSVRHILADFDLSDPMQRIWSAMDHGFVDPLVYESVMRLWSLMRTEGACPPLLLQSHLTCVLHTLATRRSQPDEPDPLACRLGKTQLADVFERIDAHLQDTLNLKDLAQACGISSFHFIRQFRQATGHTPYQYIQLRRMEKARLLLVTTQHPVADIGKAVGLPDASHFSRTFTRHAGVSPLRYREREQ